MVISALLVILFASMPAQAGNEPPIDIDREAGKAWQELILATEDPKLCEPTAVTELRGWLEANLQKQLAEAAKTPPERLADK